MKKTLSEIQKRLDNSLRAIQQGIINESVGNMITALENDKKVVENDLLRARSKQRPILTYDKCYQFLSSFAFFDTDKEKNKELILNRLVKKVIIYYEKMAILSYPCVDFTFNSGDDGFGSGGSGSDN